MQSNMLPFNISLLSLKPEELRILKQVKVLDIFTNSTKNFHSEGLFSTEIFGKVGEEKRNLTFGYIDLKLQIFHPAIYKAITDLKALYEEIMSGKTYAVFDTKIKDFVKSNPVEGETGYDFFFNNFDKIVFEERPSPKREFNIKFVEKFKSNCILDKLLVLPAGLRDYVIDSNGKPSEDEINSMYRKILNITNVLEGVDIKKNNTFLNGSRYNLQIFVNEIYKYITNMLEGKNRLLQGKWASRKIFNTTRNVITSYIPDTVALNDPRKVSSNQTIVGMYQFLRAILPLAVKLVRDTYLDKVFTGPNNPAVLVNKETLKSEMVNIDPEYYDKWMTYEGLEKIFAGYGDENIRHDILEIDNHYMLLIYKDENSFKIFQDIDDLPEGYDKKLVTGITLSELIYSSIYKQSDSIPGLVTRYPISGYGSVYPCYFYLKTTVKSKLLYELDETWNKTDNLAKEFPIYGLQFYNSMSPALAHLKRLGADFDGDTMSLMAFLTEDSKEEIIKNINSASYYVGVDGKMNFSADTDVIGLVLASMTS